MSFFVIKSKKSGLVFDVEGSSKAPGARILQFPQHNTDNQLWETVDFGGGEFAIRSKNSGLVLDIKQTPPIELSQFGLHGGPNQRWGFASQDVTDGGFVAIQSKFNGLALDVEQGSTKPLARSSRSPSTAPTTNFG